MTNPLHQVLADGQEELLQELKLNTQSNFFFKNPDGDLLVTNVGIEWLASHQAAILAAVREEAERLKSKLIDRDTNLGMNEAYRAALDDLLAALEVK